MAFCELNHLILWISELRAWSCGPGDQWEVLAQRKMRNHLGDSTTSTNANAALLPMAAPMGDNNVEAQAMVARKTGNNTNNNGFLRRSNNNISDDKSPALPILLAEDTERSATTDDVVMTELGSSRVDVRGIKRGTNNRCYYLRQYRCQLIFVLIAFVEFGLLIAGLTFYLSGVLTATCDHGNRQGKATQ